MGSAEGPPPLPDFDAWVVNQIILLRVTANAFACQLNAIPLSESRLRDGSHLPIYSFLRNLVGILKSTAHGRGVAIPALQDIPADWNEEAAADYKALAALFRPHLTEPARVPVDWAFGLRDRDPKPHWASEVAVDSVVLDMLIQMLSAVDGKNLEGSGWEPYIAQMTGDEIKGLAGVMREELLRIRAQPGSGWDEEEAKRLTIEQVENMMGLTAGRT